MTVARIVATIFLIMLFVSFLSWGIIGVINFSASFISFSIVAIATFFGYKKLVLSPSSKPTGEESALKESEDGDEESKKVTKMSLLKKTYKGWLFPARLLAYGLFVLVFLYFANNNILHIFAFLIGIAVLPISALVFIFFLRREF